MAEEKQNTLKPLAAVEVIVRALSSKRARNIEALYIEKQTVLADYFVICNGTSRTQIKALADEVEFKMTEAGLPPLHIEGVADGTWILLDFASVIVHIFSGEAREFYQLEKLWSEAEAIDVSAWLTED